ncbi:MAG: pirin family protein [Chitinophagaceae bacterium]|nr:MAG: pirin family protein [Chitinophagaceae bacterium]
MSTHQVHTSESRGVADHGWLKSRHTFSFGGYFDPERIQFGALRVLNDDFVTGGQGFGEHPHKNMEIISIPLDGQLYHKDSMGNETSIVAGEIQVMSAGTGIFHSEYNKSDEDPVRFLQIWLLPKVQNVTPRYDQRTYDLEAAKNTFVQILSPDQEDDNVWIYQDAWFSMGMLDADSETEYTLKRNGNGVYIFVLEGEIQVEGEQLGRRDAIAIRDIDKVLVRATSTARVLLMDVPL